MSIGQDYVDQVGAAINEACPLASADNESIAAITAKIRSYDEKLGFPPAESIVISWCIPYEQALLKKREDAEADARTATERKTARRKEVERYLSDSALDKAEVIRDARGRFKAPEPPRPAVAVNTAYTAKEIDAMSAAEYKEKVLGVEKTIGEQINRSGPDEEARKLLEKRVFRAKRKTNDPEERRFQAALRRQIREGLGK